MYIMYVKYFYETTGAHGGAPLHVKYEFCMGGPRVRPKTNMPVGADSYVRPWIQMPTHDQMII